MQSVWFYQVEYKIAVSPNTQISQGEKNKKLNFCVQTNRNWDVVFITPASLLEMELFFLKLIFLGCIAAIVACHLWLNQYCRRSE